MDSINNASCKFGSDAWLELQAFKTRQLNRKEKLKRHKNIHQDLISGLASSQGTSSSIQNESSSIASLPEQRDKQQIGPAADKKTGADSSHSSNSSNTGAAILETPSLGCDNSRPSEVPTHSNLDLVECLLLLKLCDVALKLPIDSKSLQLSICRRRGLESTTQSVVENLLQKFALQELITIDEPTTRAPNLLFDRRKTLNTYDEDKQFDEAPCIYVTAADHTRLVDFDKSIGSNSRMRALILESTDENSEVLTEHESFFYINHSVPIQTVKSLEGSSSISKARLESYSKDSDSSIRQQDTQSSQSISNTHSTQTKNSSALVDTKHGDDIESLLLLSSTKEKESKKIGEELLELLSKPTAKERDLLERFRSADGYQVQEFCPKGTKGECNRKNKGQGYCNKLHFKKIIAKHTEESLGDCSFLNTCFHMDSCKYVHYEVDYDDSPTRGSGGYQFKKPQPVKPKKFVPIVDDTINYHHNFLDKRISTNPPVIDSSCTSNIEKATSNMNPFCDSSIESSDIKTSNCESDVTKYVLSPEEQAQIEIKNRKRFKTVLHPPQWIQCDLRFFDMSLLGKFSVVMADPPWDIHMELPYGTMSDDEMRKLNIPALQDEGVIFLWVTGRAMELGRECLALWGYERCDEIIWVKTNQLQRIIRTGRTGHWLNHGKEHCLVGVKGTPKDVNRGLDCDVIVAEVRATSHKPDEIYGIIERLSPGTRKIELFGRAHNVQPNWITLGNQLNGVQLIEPNLVNAFKKLNLPFQTTEQ